MLVRSLKKMQTLYSNYEIPIFKSFDFNEMLLNSLDVHFPPVDQKDSDLLETYIEILIISHFWKFREIFQVSFF